MGRELNPKKQNKLKEAMNEIARLKRQVQKQALANQLLSIIGDNQEKLRLFEAEEKKKQYLYNDLLIKSCPNMIFLFDKELKLVLCSDACFPILKHNKLSKLKNRVLSQLFSNEVDAIWVDKIEIQNRQALEDLQECSYDDTLIFSERDMHVQARIAPIIKNDICFGTIMTINDITELEKTKRKAQQAAISKSSFLANMSHEIRTPMNAIKGLAELLLHSSLNEIQKTYVKNILGSSSSLISTINEVLDYSKIDTDKLQLFEIRYDIDEMLAEVCNMIAMKANEKGLMFVIETSPNMPSAFFGDDVRIKQILVNILSNAIEYTSQGIVGLKVHSETRNGNVFLVCEVQDTGIGIYRQDIPFLFDAFARMDLRMNRSVSGAGLGLAISRKLVRAMGGEIYVESEYGKGSVFTFAVPQKIADASPLAKVENVDEKKVLLVGENQCLESARNMLGMLGVRFESLENINEYNLADTEKFTHCICCSGAEEEKELFAKLKHCYLGSLRDMSDFANEASGYDLILFAPLMVKTLANFLNQKKGSKNKAYDDIRVEPKSLSTKDTTMLVVDDNEINLMVSEEMLKTFDVNVVCASGGAMALEICEKQKFDIIFLDHIMPEIDGLEVATRLRAYSGPNQKTPLVMLTANVMNGREEFYLQSGVDDYIDKPVGLDDLSRVLFKWLPVEKTSKGETGFSTEEMQDIARKLIEAGIEINENFAKDEEKFVSEMARIKHTVKFLQALIGTVGVYKKSEKWGLMAEELNSLTMVMQDIGAKELMQEAQKLEADVKSNNLEGLKENTEAFITKANKTSNEISVLLDMN